MAQNYEIVYPIYQSDIDGISVCDKSAIKANAPLIFNEKSPYYTGGEINFSLHSDIGILKQIKFYLSDKATEDITFKIIGYRESVLISEICVLKRDDNSVTSIEYFNSIISITPDVDSDLTLRVNGNYLLPILGSVMLNSTSSKVSIYLINSPLKERVKSTLVCGFTNFKNLSSKSFLNSFAILPDKQGLAEAQQENAPSEAAFFETNFGWMVFFLLTDTEEPLNIIINLTITD